jgi:hypothetical protein
MGIPAQQLAFDIDGGHVEPPAQVGPATEEPEELTPAPTRTDHFFTTEQLEKARREERDKHQRQIARQKEELAKRDAELEDLRKFREEQDAARQADERKKAKAARQEQEKDLSAKELIAIRDREHEAQMAQLEAKLAARDAEREQEKILLAHEREYLRVQAYRSQRVAEELAAESIPNELTQYIQGATEEEIEASIAQAQETAAKIVAAYNNQRGDEGGPPARLRGPSITSGPSSMGSMQELDTGDEARNMSYADYVKNRPKLMVSQQGQGIFS